MQRDEQRAERVGVEEIGAGAGGQGLGDRGPLGEPAGLVDGVVGAPANIDDFPSGSPAGGVSFGAGARSLVGSGGAWLDDVKLVVTQ